MSLFFTRPLARQIIQAQWKESKSNGKDPVYVHGWLKDLSTGLIKDLECSQGPDWTG
jgi:hypothetical protein